jgi:hypothetical protein
VAETVKCKLHSSWSGGYGPFSRTNDSEGLCTRVIRWVCEKIAKNVAQPIFYPSNYIKLGKE